MTGQRRPFSRHFRIVSSVLMAMFLLRASGQQPIDPVDFRPFVDGAHWIVRQPMTYRIGNSQDTVTVPIGFVTDFASIPPALQSIIRQNGLYLLPAVVHDYLYWTQSCTRAQADQIFLIAMTENAVGAVHRTALYQAVNVAGGFAWDDNARERAAGLPRILPPDRQQITAATLWPSYRQDLAAAGVVDPVHAPVSQAFCRRGDMSVEDALR
jgi:hypothetical protein